MKKFLVILMFTVFSLPVLADEDLIKDIRDTRDFKTQKMVTEIGFKILNANKIDKRVIFNYKTNKVVNAFAMSDDKSVSVLKGILPYCDSEDEIAAIIAHEIAHQLDFYQSYWHTVGMNFAPKKYEYKADLVGVDLMVKAGYNPLAAIVAYNKMMGELNFFQERFATHPNASKRMMVIYEHIYVKYPKYLVNNDYKNNIYYQNFLLTSAVNRKKLENKLKNKDAGFVEVKYN